MLTSCTLKAVCTYILYTHTHHTKTETNTVKNIFSSVHNIAGYLLIPDRGFCAE